MKFDREIVTLKMLSEQAELFLMHHHESSQFPEMTLDPDPGQYVKAEEAGILRWFSMRTDDGKVAGYFTFFVTQYLHHVKHKQAHQGLLYIHPDYRGPHFEKLLSFAVEYLTAFDGVEKIYTHANPKNTLHLYFERKGMKLVDRTYEIDPKVFSFLLPEKETAGEVK